MEDIMFEFLNKLFKRSETQTRPTINNKQNNVLEVENNHLENTSQTNSSTSIDLQSEIVLLWLLSQKKEPTVDNFKITKKVSTRYNLDINIALNHLLDEKLISNVNGKIVLEESGLLKLKEYNCCIVMHLHPEYALSINDFTSNPYWHKIKDNDIIWSVFNGRILEYTKAKMWSSLNSNYSNMASLLIEESKYERALDFIFASAFLYTSGMIDENTVSTYVVEINNYKVTVPLIAINKKLNLSVQDLHKKYSESKLVLSLRELLPFYYYDIEDACKFMLEAFKCGETKGIFTEQLLKVKLTKNIPDKNETKKYFYNSAENIVKKQFDL